MSGQGYAPPTRDLSTLNYEKPVTYSCGDCASKVQLKRGDPIRCLQCGHRVLYKERTTRMVQFEAR
ncbi:polymerase II polypeptide K, 7.0kDa [Trichodelitschia bisporula]|uniref:Polymerase II polypeptide K, 7.0kDa n=1 Tax=Trichodelitschia bisporula TaxID=703511 RepID=A0A6G1HZF7_9PEZI|nr:polymerase II polypeptide K, 7.0kDa [Trichodelitschia bisporula]